MSKTIQVYYHYTRLFGYNGIKQSGSIRESIQMDDGDDARFGQGVYLTTVLPWAGKRAIIEACWSPNQFPLFARNGRIDYVIEIKIPEDRVYEATSKRAVFLHKGELRLADYAWKAYGVPDSD